jgi:hypothetical protein
MKTRVETEGRWEDTRGGRLGARVSRVSVASLAHSRTVLVSDSEATARTGLTLEWDQVVLRAIERKFTLKGDRMCRPKVK